jgi:hypothetical protein
VVPIGVEKNAPEAAHRLGSVFDFGPQRSASLVVVFLGGGFVIDDARGDPMFKFEFDTGELFKKIEQWGAAADQMPYALSRALNDAVMDARRHLVDRTWPEHVTVRNSQFIGWALHIEFSDKYNLEAKIYDQSKGNVHLTPHDKGGVKTAQGRFAIPTKAVTLTAHGERTDQKPANLRNKVVIGSSIYQQQGRGKNKKLVKMYTLAHQAKQPADVPFSEDFKTVISARINAYFLPRMTEAMATRR